MPLLPEEDEAVVVVYPCGREFRGDIGEGGQRREEGESNRQLGLGLLLSLLLFLKLLRLGSLNTVGLGPGLRRLLGESLVGLGALRIGSDSSLLLFVQSPTFR